MSKKVFSTIIALLCLLIGVACLMFVRQDNWPIVFPLPAAMVVASCLVLYYTHRPAKPQGSR